MKVREAGLVTGLVSTRGFGQESQLCLCSHRSLFVSRNLQFLFQKHSWVLHLLKTKLTGEAGTSNVLRMGTRSVSGVHPPQTCRWPSCWESTVRKEKGQSQGDTARYLVTLTLYSPLSPLCCTPMKSTNFRSKLLKKMPLLTIMFFLFSSFISVTYLDRVLICSPEFPM